MLQLVQDAMYIVFGLVIIFVLLIILVKVHRQAEKMKDLENQIKLKDTVQTAEVLTNQEDKSNG